MISQQFKNLLIAALTHNTIGRDVADLINNMDYEVTFTVGAEATNVVNVSGQVKNSAGDAVAGVRTLQLGLFTTAAAVAYSTTNYTTIAIGTNGALVELVADKRIEVRTDSDGAFDIDVTLSSGAATSYLAQLKPDGTVVSSDVITHAA
jgi:hypothetical protein